MTKRLLLALTLLSAAPAAYCQSQGVDMYKESPAYKKIKARNDSIREAVNAELSKSTTSDNYEPQKDEGLVKLDTKYGFRDLRFGTPATQIKGFVPFGKPFHGEQSYTRPTDSKKVGTSTVATIIYTAYKGKLYSVTLKTTGYMNSTGVLGAFKQLYGSPSQANQYIEDYEWFGEKVTVSYSQNSITDDAIIYLWSKPILDQMDADKEQAAKKAASDL